MIRDHEARALRAGRDLVDADVPLDAAIAMSGELAKDVQPIALMLVMLVADRIAQDAESAMGQQRLGRLIDRLLVETGPRTPATGDNDGSS